MEHKIMVVEGHPVYGPRLEGFLRGLTFKHIALMSSGQAALSRGLRGDFHLYIVSSVLPDMDGVKFCTKLLASGGKKCIVLTGLFEEEDRIRQFYTIGVDRVLAKKEKDMRPLQRAIEGVLLLRSCVS